MSANPAQVSAETAPAPPAKRVVGRPFQKGQSGNPGGMPRGLASAVRAVAPADKLAEYFTAIWLRDVAKLRELKIPLKAVTLAERNKAGEWLSERGYGKAPAHAPVEGGDPLEHDSVDSEISQLVDELAERREAPAAGEADARTLAPGG